MSTTWTSAAPLHAPQQMSEKDRQWYARAGLNTYGVDGPDDCCGEVDCVCEEVWREIMTDAEYFAAYGVAKDGGPAAAVTLRSA
jgi:hypothetical protein